MKCSKCLIEKEDKDFYKKSNKIIQPCKKCRVEYQKEYQIENREKVSSYNKSLYLNDKDYFLDKAKRNYKENPEKYKNIQSNWRKNNKSKIKEYQLKRYYQKGFHKISDNQWRNCKHYFDNLCCYCGIDIETHLKINKQDFHKDHIVNDGSNDITNCVPSCKSCNSSKRKMNFEDWYNSSLDFFTEERKNKILEWIIFSKKLIE